NLFSGSGTILMPSIPGINAYLIKMPANVLASTQGTGTLTISTGVGSIVLPNNMLTSIPDTEGKQVTISIVQGDKAGLTQKEKTAVGNRPLIQLTLTLNGETIKWNNLNAPVTVLIPYTPMISE